MMLQHRDALAALTDEIRNHEILNREQEIELADKAARGCTESRNRLITCNQRLVFKIARRYVSDKAEYSDLISEGNFGLMKAIEKFDTSKGFRFSTYAVPWINQACQRYVMNHGQTVRVSVHTMQDCHALAAAMRNYHREGVHNPTVQQLAKRLEWPIEKTRDRLEAYSLGNAGDMPDGESPVDLLECTTDLAYDAETARIFEQAMDRLKACRPKDQAVILRRYGIGRDEGTLQQAGDDAGVTRERARQVHNAVVDQLRGAFKC